MKSYTTYLGVKIAKVKEYWPNLRELKDGRIIEGKPIVIGVSYQYAGSYPYSTLIECKASIDSILNRCKELGAECRPKEFAAIMNED